MENLTYEKFIQSILDTRGRFACGEKYHERHHIIPKCVGGTNEAENLIDLYAREHFIAHKLLALENPENEKLVYAWSCMAYMKREDVGRYELTPEEYEEIKRVRSSIPVSEETRKKISESNKRRNISEETRKKQSESAKARCTDEWREKTSKNLKGKIAREKHPRYGTGKHIIQLSLQGVYITEYVSSGEAQRITGIDQSSIDKCCKHIYGARTAGGFQWLFKDEYEDLLCHGKTYKIESDSILQYDTKGNFIEEWESVGVITQELNIGHVLIYKCLSGEAITAYGWMWFRSKNFTYDLVIDSINKLNAFKENRKKRAKSMKVDNAGENNAQARKVIRLSDLKIYNYGKLAAKDNNVTPATISYRCKRHNGFMYYDEWLEEEVKLSEAN